MSTRKHPILVKQLGCFVAKCRNTTNKHTPNRMASLTAGQIAPSETQPEKKQKVNKKSDVDSLPWQAAPDEWKGIPWCLIHRQTGTPAMRGCGYPPRSAVDLRDSTEYVMRKDETRKHGEPSEHCCTILAWKL